MRLPGWKFARSSLQWVRGRMGNCGLILGYHRVAVTPRDPFAMCVHPARFAAQMAWLRQEAHPISLEQMWQGLQTGSLPPRAIAVTLDDGYVDVLHAAAPVLAQYKIPATVFITTGNLGQPFWWDVLEHLILSPACLPTAFALPIEGTSHTWSLHDLHHLTLRKDALTPRQHLLHTLFERLLPLTSAQREPILAQIRAWAQVNDNPPVRAMTAEELVALNGYENITIGVHTVTHPRLADLPAAAQAAEIRDSQQTIEVILGQPVTQFSHPHGIIGSQTQQWWRDAGFNLACISQDGVVTRRSNPLALPRFWIPDWDQPDFAHWLKRWLA